MLKRDRPTATETKRPEADKKGETDGKGNSVLLDAARAAGLEIPSTSADPMSSISALLAAAKATGGLPSSSAASGPAKPTVTSSSQSAAQTAASAANQGLDLSNPAAAMANVNVSLIFFFSTKINNLHPTADMYT